jgi:hypothetical protein
VNDWFLVQMIRDFFALIYYGLCYLFGKKQ